MAPPQEHTPPKQQSAKPKMRAVDPEELEIELRHKMHIAPTLSRKPGFGTLGRKIGLISNCFPIDLPSGNIYHYDIEIARKRQSTTTEAQSAQAGSGEKDSKKYRCMPTKCNREVVNAMMSGDSKFRDVFAAYDGRKNLYSRKDLNIANIYKCNVILADENPGDPQDPRGQRTNDFEVTIKPVKKKDSNDCSISLDPLHALFAGQVKEVPLDAVMAVETVLRHTPCMRFTPLGRSFFYPPSPSDLHSLGGGREVWFGYHQSLKLGELKPMVNLNTTVTAFYSAGPVLGYIAEFLKTDYTALQKGGCLKVADIDKLSKDMTNMRIETNHMEKNNKMYNKKYKILRFTRKPANRLEFSLTVNGEQVTKTVSQYFEENYDQLKFPHLPCIQVIPEDKKVYLPIEICHIIGGQDCKQRLDGRQSNKMINFTTRPPNKTFDEITGLFQSANYNQDKFVKEFGMKVHNEPMKLEGRILDAPSVRYQRGLTETKIMPRNGQWDMRGIQYFRGAVINSWVLLNFSKSHLCNQEALNGFANLLCEIASEQGIYIRLPARVKTVDIQRISISDVLKDVKDKYMANLIICVIPNNKNIYGEVKRAAEIILGLITQCIKDYNVNKFKSEEISHLCQKINAKMGGINNSLTPDEIPPNFRRPVIIIGAHVIQPISPQDIKISIAAAVGSLDGHPSRYAATTRAQIYMDENRQFVEVILDLKGMVIDLLKAFYRNTRKKKPEKIIFFRTGVRDGKLDVVHAHEMKSIREACKTLDLEYEPGITFIVLRKSHHTRFKTQDDRQGAGKMRNIPPGTTVDRTVTHPLNFDFYQCSQFGLEGTSHPVYYTVIEDDNGYTADEIQTLTYYLCHTYVQCTKSIASPAPVMYAQQAARRAKKHLLAQMHKSSAASMDTFGSSDWHFIPDYVRNAIEVVKDLKNTMYFV